MVGKEIAVKKYVVRLSTAEHAQLDELIRKGKRSAQLLTKARIPLKADVSELGEGWSDSRISPRRWTPASPLSSGPGASWSRRGSSGVEAHIQSQFRPAADFRRRSRSKLIALTSLRPRRVSLVGACACSRRRSSNCTLSSASDNTIGRTLKTYSNRIASSNG